MPMTTMSSTGSIQNTVPAAPPQLYSPAEPRTRAATGSVTTPQPRPKPNPRAPRPNGFSPLPPPSMAAPRWLAVMNSTVFGLSSRTPSSSPPRRTISQKRR